jgi:hypothetical protein
MRLHVGLGLAAFAALTTALFAHAQDSDAETPNAEVSAFGSSAAMESYFDWEQSDFRPAHWLTEPGILKGRWLAPDRMSDLSIQTNLVGDADVGDGFVMRAGKVAWSFESSYGSFAVYGCDIDADKIDEVVIEDGMGRGTCVYRRRLTILKMFDGAWQSVFSDWLSGYLPNDQPGDPLSWKRRYRFSLVPSGGFDVVLRLIAPERVPLGLDSPEDYAVLQRPRCVLRYEADARAFRIWDETFRRLSPQTNASRAKALKAPTLVPAFDNGGACCTNF